ncbi:MAG: ExbD/TolR family protein [Planctomycetota bacterium]|jgi:biopolymer transport protein ExbD
MLKSKRADAAHKNELNMTPMIDVVFLLLIFFMIVSELATLDAEDIRIPPAKNAVRDTAPDKDLVVVNIRKAGGVGEPGEIRIRGRKYDALTLREYLREEARLAGWDDIRRRTSNLKVLIRADSECRYEAVQTVLDSCQLNGIYKTQIAGGSESPPPKSGQPY